MSVYPDGHTARDRFVLDRRAARAIPDVWSPPHVTVEQERDADGTVADVATLFLTGRECPWRCVMCDLWRHTTHDDTPAGAIASQVRAGIAAASDSRARAITTAKLYNAGSFFDPRAVPEADYDDIAAAVAGLSRVVVESHPSLIEPRASRFADALARQARATRQPTLEIAIGLETAHPDALSRLNKAMTVEAFGRAADWLRRSTLALRVFLLVSPPFIGPADQDVWLLRSVETALSAGATAIALIPTRPGNGALEALSEEGVFRSPHLRDLERSLERALPVAGRHGARVFADLWDLERFADCPACFDARRARLHSMNLTQDVLPPWSCSQCGPAAA